MMRRSETWTKALAWFLLNPMKSLLFDTYDYYFLGEVILNIQTYGCHCRVGTCQNYINSIFISSAIE